MAAPSGRRMQLLFKIFWPVSFRCGRSLTTSAVLFKRADPLGPMPNENIKIQNLESLEKYRSYTRYLKVAEQEAKKSHWWKTYKYYIAQDSGESIAGTDDKVDIGLPYQKSSRKKQVIDRNRQVKENHRNPELERAARHRSLLIPLDKVKEEWEKVNGPYQMQSVAEHYGIYWDLFHEATFVPWVILHVEYSTEEETVLPVHRGNVVTPSEAFYAPGVTFEAEEGSLWTLLLTNPDGHLRDNESEYLHWLVGNIPGNVVESGDQLCHYFPPFPAKGTGYHRFIFILFKQDTKIDFNDECRPSPCHSLKMRTFHTFDFYKKYQDFMTPAGLAFFQSRWDESVTQVFHHMLRMKEPVFEYDCPPVYHPPQKKFPHGQPLRYLDRYRDSDEPTYGIY